jgi:gliding motility-associated-like protein
LKTFQQILFLLCCFFNQWANAQQSSFDFIENKGQWDSRVKFRGDIPSGAFFLEKNGFTVLLQNPEELRDLYLSNHLGANKIIIAGSKNAAGSNPNSTSSSNNSTPNILHAHAYKVTFVGGNPDAVIAPDKAQDSYNNYFIGNDSSKWASNCKIYRIVTYKNIYPGIDVRYYSENGTLKYDLLVNPGADPSNIVMKYEGINKLETRKGQLVIKTSVGDVKELEPYSYQFDDVKGKTEVGCSYKIGNDNTVRFKLKNYSSDVPLIIDPTLIFSTFNGSPANTYGFTACPGPGGTFFSGCLVFGTGYPVTLGAFQQSFAGGTGDGGRDIGIMKFNTTGSARLYSTYIGGSANEYPHSIISDPQGNLIVMGRTYSSNYPTYPGVNVVGKGGGADLVVTKLNASGTALIGSMRIGGVDDDCVNIHDEQELGFGSPAAAFTVKFYGDDSRSEVNLDAAGNIYVAAQTQSDSFPVTPGVFQPKRAGKQDGVVLKINPSCSKIIFSSFLGGTENDGAFVIDINPLTNNIYVGGATCSSTFPGVNSGAVQSTYSGGVTDGFVTEIANDGSSIIRTTFLGTSGFDGVYGVKFDKLGYPYAMGVTTGQWPIKNASPFYDPSSTQFIVKLLPDLSATVYSTVFGTGKGNPNISPVAFLVDRCENVYISGWGGFYENKDNPYQQGGVINLPVTADAIKGSNSSQTDNRDFYFIVIKKNATALLYATCFGQNGGLGEHVDGGTSRYDQQGVIYQAICANCGANYYYPITKPYPITPGVVGPRNGTGGAGCNLGAVKMAFNFAGVNAGLKLFINGVADTAGCIPLTIEFRDTIRNAKSYEWYFGDGSPMVKGTNFSITHTYNAVGFYKVMMVAVDSTTCNMRDTSYATVRAGDMQAFVNFTFTKLPPCTSLGYQFTNTSTLSAAALGHPFTNTSFIWDFGDGSPRIVSGPVNGIPDVITHSYQSPGTYNVKLILNDTSYCNSPDSMTIVLRVSPLVRAQFSTPPTGCAPYMAVFENTSLGGESFTWDFGDSYTSTEVSPTHLYTTPGTYTIKLVAVDNNTCNKVHDTTMTILVSSTPKAGYTYSPLTPQQNFPYTFTNTSSPDAVRFFWSFGDADTLATTSRASFEHQYNSSGFFDACLTAYNNVGCADTVCNQLQNIILPRMDVPNAFTPGGNSANNTIFVRGYGIGTMHWRIYNRFGNLVFETSNPEAGWDGKYKGVLQPMDVYAYTLEVGFTDGTKTTKKGDITLLR